MHLIQTTRVTIHCDIKNATPFSDDVTSALMTDVLYARCHVIDHLRSPTETSSAMPLNTVLVVVNLRCASANQTNHLYKLCLQSVAQYMNLLAD